MSFSRIIHSPECFQSYSLVSLAAEHNWSIIQVSSWVTARNATQYCNKSHLNMFFQLCILFCSKEHIIWSTLHVKCLPFQTHVSCITSDTHVYFRAKPGPLLRWCTEGPTTVFWETLRRKKSTFLHELDTDEKCSISPTTNRVYIFHLMRKTTKILEQKVKRKRGLRELNIRIRMTHINLSSFWEAAYQDSPGKQFVRNEIARTVLDQT
jgi:hypothetical protein